MSQLELGKNTPSLNTLFDMAEIFRVDPAGSVHEMDLARRSQRAARAAQMLAAAGLDRPGRSRNRPTKRPGERRARMAYVKDIAEIRKLPLPERLHLVGQIWESILDDSQSLPVSDELLRELEASLAEHRANPDTSLPWEDVDREVFGDD